MSEPHTEPDNAGAFLTVAQASAALGVSSRSIQKRCASGKIAARRIVTPQGAKWEIDANQLARTGEQSTRTREPEPRTGELKMGEPANDGREPIGAHVQNDANLRTGGADYAARLIEAQAAEIAFLRAQIEAANLNAARWAQQARDAQRLCEKALPAPGEDSGHSHAQEAAQGAQNPETGKEAAPPMLEAQRPPEPQSGAQIEQSTKPARGSWWRRLIGG